MGLSGNDLAALGMGAMGGLSPDMLAKLQAGNIQNMELRMKPDGLHVYVNGEPLPLVIWDSALLKNVVDLYGQLSPDASRCCRSSRRSCRTWTGRTSESLLHFPPAAGKDVIPAKMHE